MEARIDIIKQEHLQRVLKEAFPLHLSSVDKVLKELVETVFHYGFDIGYDVGYEDGSFDELNHDTMGDTEPE